MSLAAGALAMGRQLARTLMTDTWRCERGSAPVFDDVTGEWTSPPGEVVYDGPGRLRDVDGDAPRTVAQGETTVASSLRLSLPVETSTLVAVDDFLVCTASVEDVSLVGTRVRVTDLHLQTHSTARRFSVVVETWPTTT